jgi:hypothetical protein
MELMQTEPDLADLEDLPSEMTTAINGEVEVSADELKEMSQERTAEFEEYTAEAREASRETKSAKDSGVEDDLLHNSPENLVEPKEATPSPDQTVAQKHRQEAQNKGEDMTESQPEEIPPRVQASWVTDAVAACQANKKVRFLDIPNQDKTNTNTIPPELTE